MSEGYVEDSPQLYQGESWGGQPIPVTMETQEEAPEYGSTGVYTLLPPGQAQPVQLLQRRARRYKAKILITSLVTTSELLPASPAAGAVFNYVNNTGVPQSLASISWIFTTSAAVANRFVGMRILDTAGNIVAANADLSAVVASSTVQVWLAQGLSNLPNAASGSAIGGLPSNLLIQPGWTVRIFATSIDVADQISSIVMTFNGQGTAVFHNQSSPLAAPTLLPGVGIQINSAPFLFEWESQQPLYGVALGGNITVSVIDESYADRESSK